MSSPPVPPRRWAQSDSGVGPVVQAVVRYAQSEAPSAARLEGIRQGVLAHGDRRRRAPRAALWAAALLVPSALVVGWLAFVRPHDEMPALTLTQEPPTARRNDPAPAPVREPVSAVTSPTSARSARPPKRVAPPNPALRQVTPEIETLQRARRLLSDKPADALLLTTQHATQHPRSEFTEEREALRIEALVRLGRQAVARRHFDSFAEHHPRSVYLRRMQAWFPEAGNTLDAALTE